MILRHLVKCVEWIVLAACILYAACQLRGQIPPTVPILRATVGSSHTVTLAWDYALTLGVTFNIYHTSQGQACLAGSPILLTRVASGIVDKTWVYKSAPAGAHCYAVTAILNGEESTYSNYALALVPFVGPLVGLRLPVWDTLNYRYWTPETRLDWDRSFGLRQSADGYTQTFHVKLPSYTFGRGLMTAQVVGSDLIQVFLDSAYVLMLSRTSADPEPVPGEECRGSAGVVVGQSGVYFCKPPSPLTADGSGWTWRRLRWE